MITGNAAVHTDDTSSQPSRGELVVLLLKGIIYRDADARRWSHLLNLQNAVQDYVSELGLELILDEAEGYAFLRTRAQDTDDEEAAPDAGVDMPRLIVRRQLSFPVSLLLALLRKKLAEFDASAGDPRLVLTRNQLLELYRVFMPESSNEARLVDQVERHINKVVELGFLRPLKPESPASQPAYEVRRIIKAFVDAQWLAGLDEKLESYRQHASGSEEIDE